MCRNLLSNYRRAKLGSIVYMSKMISAVSGFQYSVNIGYDLGSNDKLKNFIPTKSALNLLEEILLSTKPTSTERSRILIGAYGKGKSHIVLMILSMLMKKKLSLFEKMLPKIQENEQLWQLVQNYYDSDNKLLPVVITGSNTSLSQAFLLALQRTLRENELMDVMPETNYKAAIAVINRWKKDFPSTYEQFKTIIQIPVNQFIANLEDYDVETYKKFELIYPSLTAGSVFNPFLGFDVVELYAGVVKSLRLKGYTGIYVVFDEFSKYLETNISDASVSDTKMLQDFAEKCNRSGEQQMHLMLISHKEIVNYIDTLPKKKIDGWRGVSERFKHIHLNNNFTQTYEIIASVIQKNNILWKNFYEKNIDSFMSLKHRYSNHAIFSDATENEVDKIITACYPLHPVSTFILPRLSERIAQNERTLFTFLSADGISTLPAFLARYNDDQFEVITPDLIFDYFEPLFKKEMYSSDLHEHYVLAMSILSKLDDGSLEQKIIKTLSLIYILEQFEKLKPTKDELVGIYSIGYTIKEIEIAINNLIDKEYVVYLKRSNNYLQLKKTSGIDVRRKIKDFVESRANRLKTKDILNASNFENYIYPARYNDEREMTRYFTFKFIDADEVTDETNWERKSEGIEGDGIVYGIIPKNQESIEQLHKSLLLSSSRFDRFIFILPKRFIKIQDVANEFSAVTVLRDSVADDRVLFDEYEVIYEDLREVINSFIHTYTHPESFKSFYIYKGKDQLITRKSALTGLMSDICDRVYSETPIINNEAINKNEITSIARNSRKKIVAALLRNELEQDLGLTGTGPEISIMRSTLLRTGILDCANGFTKINLKPDNPLMANMLNQIVQFIMDSRKVDRICFSELYQRLMAPENHIGLRKGLIPIYVAAVFHEYKQNLIISDRFGQVSINADTLLQINANPSGFYLSFLGWNPEKEKFIERLTITFADYIVQAEKNVHPYEYIATAMRRWYMNLPKYTKETGRSLHSLKNNKKYQAMIRLLKQNIGSYELLFVKLPKVFGYAEEFNAGLAENIAEAKNYYDQIFAHLKKELVEKVKEIFILPQNKRVLHQSSLASVIKDWCETLDTAVFNQLFSDGTEKCLYLFRTITNDEDDFITRLAKLATDLRLEDWDDKTYARFIERVKQYKATAEQFENKEAIADGVETNTYQITFIGENGEAVTKRFEKIKCSNRSKLLYNSITAALDSMGQSISEQEKRQILMDVLKTLC